MTTSQAPVCSVAEDSKLTPEQTRIIKLAIALTDANDRGDELTDQWEQATDEERVAIEIDNERADQDYNKAKAALFAAVRKHTGHKYAARIRGWERDAHAAIAASTGAAS